jgi:hypothetical protein
MQWEFRFTFEDGVAAGDRLLALLEEIHPDWAPDCRTFMSASDQQPILDWLWSRLSGGRPIPYVQGFLSRVLKDRGLGGDPIIVFGTGDLVGMQTGTAPINLMPPDSGLVEIASWAGDGSDGDAWCLDGKRGCVRGVGLSCGSSDVQEVRAWSYAVLPTFDHWVSYLRTSFTQRGYFRAPAASPRGPARHH